MFSKRIWLPSEEMCPSLCHCKIWRQTETVAVYSCTATVLILYLGSKSTSIRDLRKVLEDSGINRCDRENQTWSCKKKNEILRVLLLLFVGLFFSFLTKPWRLRCWLVVGESRQDIIAIATILSVNTLPLGVSAAGGFNMASSLTKREQWLREWGGTGREFLAAGSVVTMRNKMCFWTENLRRTGGRFI